MVHCKVKKGIYEEEFEVEKILDVRGSPEERFYLVRWKGDWKENKETWQNWRDVTKAQSEVDAICGWLEEEQSGVVHRRSQVQDLLQRQNCSRNPF
jgi:hypothetical protein